MLRPILRPIVRGILVGLYGDTSVLPPNPVPTFPLHQYNFDAVDDFVTFLNSLRFIDTAGDIDIEWETTGHTGGTNRCIVSQNVAASIGSRELVLVVTSGGMLQFECRGAVTTLSFDATANGVYRVSLIGNALTLYKDGVVTNSTTLNRGAVIEPSAPTIVGARTNGSLGSYTDYCGGVIKNLKINGTKWPMNRGTEPVKNVVSDLGTVAKLQPNSVTMDYSYTHSVGGVPSAAVTETATNAGHSANIMFIPPVSGQVTCSVYVKAGLRNFCRVACTSSSQDNAVNVDLTTGAVELGSTTGHLGTFAAGAVDAGNGWWRVWVRRSVTDSTTNLFFIVYGTVGLPFSSPISYVGDASAPAFYCAGWSVEQGSLTPFQFVPFEHRHNLQLPDTGLGQELITAGVHASPNSVGEGWSYLGNGRWQFINTATSDNTNARLCLLPALATGYVLTYNIEYKLDATTLRAIPSGGTGDTAVSFAGRKVAVTTVATTQQYFAVNGGVGSPLRCVISDISIRPIQTAPIMSMQNTVASRWSPL